MNSKRIIAVLAVMTAVFAAFAAVPLAGDDADTSSDEKETVYLHGDFTSNLSYTQDQIVVVDADLNIIDGGKLEVLGEFIVNKDATVTIEGADPDDPTKTSQLFIKGDATVNGSIISKAGIPNQLAKAGLVIQPINSYNEVVVNGTIAAMGDETGTRNATVSIGSQSVRDFNMKINGTFTVGTNAHAAVWNVLFGTDSKFLDYGMLVGSISLSGYVLFDGEQDLFTIYVADASAVVDIKEVKGNGPIIMDQGLYAYTFCGVDYYIGAAPQYASGQTGAAVAYDEDNETFYNSSDVLLKVSSNTSTFSNTKNIRITERVETFTVFDPVTSEDRMYAKTHMVISALDGVIVSSADGASGSIGLAGKTVELDTMTVMGCSVSVSDGGIITGDVRYPVQPATTGGAPKFIVMSELKVEGFLLLEDTDAMGYQNIIAAKYTVKQADNTVDYCYASVERAIKNGATDITMTGAWIVRNDIAIPSGVKLTAAADSTQFSALVMKGATLTVASGAKFVMTGKIIVNGAFVIENIDYGITINESSIFADAKRKDGSSFKYSDIATAFADAKSGDEVKAFNPQFGMIFVREDLTLPAGVTFDPLKFAVIVSDGKTFAVAGKLIMHTIRDYPTSDRGNVRSGVITTYFSPDTVKMSLVYGAFGTTPTYVESGVLKERAVLKIAGDGIIQVDPPQTGFYMIYCVAGAYYYTDDGKMCITSPASAFGMILDVKDNTVSICGEVEMDGLNVTGTEKERVNVFLRYGNHDVKGFTFAYGEIYVESGVTITGDIGTSSGRMVFDGTQFFMEVIFKDEFVNGAMNLTVNGEEGFPGAMCSENETVIKGSVYFKDITYLGEEAVLKDCGDRRLTVDSGAELFIIGDTKIQSQYSSNEAYGTELCVKGNLTVNYPGKLTAEIVSVTGTMSVNKIDGNSGIADVKNYIIGGTTGSFHVLLLRTFSGDAVLKGDGMFILDNSTVSLFSGATVSADVMRDWMDGTAKSTEFYVDDSLWMSVFTQSDHIPLTKVVEDVDSLRFTARYSDYVFEKIVGGDNDGKYMVYNFVPALDSCAFESWQTYNEKSKTYTSVSGDTNIGDPGYEKVYAKLDKDYFSVKIIADAGIDNIYLNGKVMLRDKTANIFRADVVAGTYTITYALANGYSGNAVITTIDGNALVGGGMTFVINDDKYDDVADEMVITLSGIEKSGYDTDPDTHPDEGVGLSTMESILIAVVVLMALISVLVVLRLNRK